MSKIYLNIYASFKIKMKVFNTYLILYLIIIFYSSLSSALESVHPTIIETSSIMTPVADEACFAPNEPCDVKLIKFVESAKISLDIAIFDINLESLVHAILLQ